MEATNRRRRGPKILIRRYKKEMRDIKSQETFTRMRRMATLEYYCRIKKSWNKEEYIDRLERKEIAGWAWFRL